MNYALNWLGVIDLHGIDFPAFDHRPLCGLLQRLGFPTPAETFANYCRVLNK